METNEIKNRNKENTDETKALKTWTEQTNLQQSGQETKTLEPERRDITTDVTEIPRLWRKCYRSYTSKLDNLHKTDKFLDKLLKLTTKTRKNNLNNSLTSEDYLNNPITSKYIGNTKQTKLHTKEKSKLSWCHGWILLNI